ncbi:FecR domain-containing protein [Pseudomonas solani]|uniref:FecR domain-containing protein n=1 Tax=Pseudomonas solani TaxID=2731552 RepID=UPI003C2FF304
MSRSALELSDAEREAIRAAAQWYARLASGAASEATQQAWQRWHAADPLHQAAWHRIEAVRDQVGQVPGRLASSSLQGATQSRRLVLRGLVALASAGALGDVGWRSEPGQRLAADFSSGVGERRRFTLDDGSQLMLDTRSAVDLRFDATQRLLVLRSGALLVETAPDPLQRPFMVETPHGRVRALGTRFTVTLGEAGSQVAVLEKAVEVSPREGTVRVRLEAGQQLGFSRDAVGNPQPVDAATAAWTQGSLIAIDRPLGELLAELSRYRSGWLRCDPRIAGVRVSGAFPLGDTDLALAALESGFPVTVVRRTRYWVTLVPRG